MRLGEFEDVSTPVVLVMSLEGFLIVGLVLWQVIAYASYYVISGGDANNSRGVGFLLSFSFCLTSSSIGINASGSALSYSPHAILLPIKLIAYKH